MRVCGLMVAIATPGLTGCQYLEPEPRVTIPLLVTAPAIPPAGPMSLSEAMARVLAASLRDRLEQIITMERLDPTEAPNAPVFPAALAPVALQRPSSLQADLADGWQALDVAITYRTLRAGPPPELRRRILLRQGILSLVQQARLAWTRVQLADRLLPTVDGLIARLSTGLDTLRQQVNQGAAQRQVLADRQADTVRLLDRLWPIRQELGAARTALATLMGLPAGTPITAAPDDRPGPPPIPDGFAAGPDAYAAAAFLQRPPLSVTGFDATSARSVLLAWTPSLPLDPSTGGGAIDSTWVRNAAFLAGSAMAADDRSVRAALAAAGLAQVHLAWRDMRRSQALLANFGRAANRTLEILQVTRGFVSAARSGDGPPIPDPAGIQAQVDALVAELRRDLMIAYAWNAMLRLRVATGSALPPADATAAAGLAGGGLQTQVAAVGRLRTFWQERQWSARTVMATQGLGTRDLTAPAPSGPSWMPSIVQPPAQPPGQSSSPQSSSPQSSPGQSPVATSRNGTGPRERATVPPGAPDFAGRGQGPASWPGPATMPGPAPAGPLAPALPTPTLPSPPADLGPIGQGEIDPAPAPPAEPQSRAAIPAPVWPRPATLDQPEGEASPGRGRPTAPGFGPTPDVWSQETPRPHDRVPPAGDQPPPAPSPSARVSSYEVGWFERLFPFLVPDSGRDRDLATGPRED